MKFGPTPVADAVGAVLAHSVALPGGRLRKGRPLSSEDIAALAAAGHESVIVARLDPMDVDENTAAARLAAALVPDPAARGLLVTEAFTGRVNLLAEGPGVALLDVPALQAVNRIDPMISFATVLPFQQMHTGGMVGTIKIISYAVPEAPLAAACAAVGDGVRLAGPSARSAELIVTEIPGGAGDKGATAIANRLAAFDIVLGRPRRVPHRVEALAQALTKSDADVTLILTGSATSDPFDVAPEALRRAGGKVARFGMPVDPGNLLFIGHRSGRPVIGLPGCARSPALNGTDWVLARVVCGIDVSSEDIAGMGVGGLLKEIPSRPQPRRGG
ncbi:MAG: molybdopterin-binding protein [Pseudomonadota bacterium]